MLVVAAAVAVVGVWPVVVSASSRRSETLAGSASYTDPAGDSGAGPDVQSVAVSDS